MITDAGRKKIPEQRPQHFYIPHPVPARSSATVTEEPTFRARRQPEANGHRVPDRASAPITEEPPVSRQRMRQEGSNASGDTQRLSTSPQTPSGRNPSRIPVFQEEEDGNGDCPQRSPSSARRYTPSHPQEDASRRPSRSFSTLIVGSSVLAGILIALLIPPLWQRGSDQFQYGFPRTYQVDANVGHGTKQYPDTHFIALNNRGYVEVIEIPEGVPDRSHPPQMYLVARPDNATADQAPATLTFEDVLGNGKMDMIVHCNGNEVILYNDGSTFKPTP